MTTPGMADAPDGAYVVDDGKGFGRNENEASIKKVIREYSFDPWVIAQQAFAQMFEEQYKSNADLRDGQNSLRDRIELLKDNDGYVSSVMGYNWIIPPSKWVVVPFDAQLGPAKNASVFSPVDESGWLLLKAGGLWRIDVRACLSGWTTHHFGGTTGEAQVGIQPSYMIEVVRGNQLISAKQFDVVSDFYLHNVDFINSVVWPFSSAFNHTVVLPDMPPVNDPTAPDHWVQVRLSVKYEPITNVNGFRHTSRCQIQGGTRRSALLATRWSKDTDNAISMPTVPDGGTIG